MAENLSQRILTFHTGAYEPYENAIDAVFSRDVSMAQSVRAEGERIASKFRGI